FLQLSSGSSICEWKGAARYWTLKSHARSSEPVGWSYPNPNPPFETIASYFSFYPARLECYVEGERVQPQPGEFYGGWGTHEIVGPFQGRPGTERWWSSHLKRPIGFGGPGSGFSSQVTVGVTGRSPCNT